MSIYSNISFHARRWHWLAGHDPLEGEPWSERLDNSALLLACREYADDRADLIAEGNKCALKILEFDAEEGFATCHFGEMC